MRKYTVVFLSLMLVISLKTFAQPFRHPGLLQSAEDLIRIKAGVRNVSQPIYAGYEVFKVHPQSSSDYIMKGPMDTVGRNPTIGQEAYDSDANAAYQNAIMWSITGEKRYAERSIAIINAWAAALKAITGRDAVLMAGLGPFKMVNAAEILRYTASGWNVSDIAQAERYFRTVVYPVIKNMAPFANGNWDSAALKTIMAIAVFCNDRVMFENALVYYRYGAGDGSLRNYIVTDYGQCQESGRDQGHTQLGVAHLADCCEIAWNQGLDLYGIDSMRILKGFEYTAKYNLGNEVEYHPLLDRSGKYKHEHISSIGRGKLRAIYEEVYNHFVNRQGLQAPYTQQAAEKLRPETQGLPGADHIGFGTLLYSRQLMSPIRSSAEHVSDLCAPGGLFAENHNQGIRLDWVPSAEATSYQLMRSERSGGPYKMLVKGLRSASYLDSKVKKGSRYFYALKAEKNGVFSRLSYPVSLISGIPPKWKAADYDKMQRGKVNTDGFSYLIEGAGTGQGENQSGGMLLLQKVNYNTVIQSRYVPQFSSQFTSFGITFHGSADKSASCLNLTVLPISSGKVESPDWYVQLSLREENNNKSQILFTSPVLKDPIVTFSRMTGYIWLRLNRKGESYAADYSSDGVHWVSAGFYHSKTFKPREAGLFVYSGSNEITTVIKFDRVKISSM